MLLSWLENLFLGLKANYTNQKIQTKPVCLSTHGNGWNILDHGFWKAPLYYYLNYIFTAFILRIQQFYYIELKQKFVTTMQKDIGTLRHL